MKILKPQITSQMSQWSALLESGADLRGVEISGPQWMGMEAERLVFDTVRIGKAMAAGSHFHEPRFWHAVLTGCEFSGAIWTEASLDRVEFKDCRFKGCSLGLGEWKNVTLLNCQLDEVNFRQSKLTQVRFDNCRLHRADFSGSRMEDVEFASCDLAGAMFRGAQLSEVDLRTSKIAEIASADGLSGATVDNHQLIEIAHQMAAQLGISVRAD